MTRLHQLLEEASADASAVLVHPELAQATWVAGRRRRRLQRVAAAAVVLPAVVATLAVSALVVRPYDAPLTSASPTDADAPSTYPARIERVISDAPLPARPGALAGVGQRYFPTTEEASYVGVTPAGLRWTIASDDPPLLTPDGATLLTTDNDARVIRVHDLVWGTQRSVPVDVRQPGGLIALSADGRFALVKTSRDAYLRGVQVLDLRRDSLSRRIPLSGAAVGLTPDGDVIAVRPSRDADGAVVESVTIVDSPTGRLLSSVELHPQAAWSTRTLLTAEAVSASPAADRIAIFDDDSVSTFSTTTGAELGRTSVEVARLSVNLPAPVAWVGETPVVSEKTDTYSTSTVAAGSDGTRRLVAIDPRLHVQYVVWAHDALNGRPATAPLGTWQAWWSWHVHALILWLAVVAVGCLALVSLAVGVGVAARRTGRAR